ncbi:S8 family serine peptidase [Exiguobacterium sp. R-17]|uniref:S8 family serine peptidase n=1 Tax=Exiguobacterium sp. R-17 TaxID=3404054 RepID=UPI003CEE0717
MNKLSIFFLIIFFTSFLSSCNLDNSRNDVNCFENWSICKTLSQKKYKIDLKRKTKIAILDSGITKNDTSLKITKTFDTLSSTPNKKTLLHHGNAVHNILSNQLSAFNNKKLFDYIEVYDVRVLNPNGKGTLEDVVQGIEWSIENKVDVINISFGFQRNYPELKKVIAKANSLNIVVVAAAGNNFGLSTDYPAKYSNVLSISSINQKNQIDPFASTGKVDFVAPGVNLPLEIDKSKNQNQLVSGTSFATAIATGIISIINSTSKQKMNKKEMVNDLQRRSFKFDKYSDRSIYGNGLLKY